jgi:hypothetical protein
MRRSRWALTGFLRLIEKVRLQRGQNLAIEAANVSSRRKIGLIGRPRSRCALLIQSPERAGLLIMMPSAHAQARQFGVFRANSGNRYVVAPRDRRSFKPSLCSLWSVFSGNGILTPETRGRKWPRVFHRCLARDQAPTRKPANSGFFAQTREISVRLRLRGGGCSRSRTSLHPITGKNTGKSRFIGAKISAACIR